MFYIVIYTLNSSKVWTHGLHFYYHFLCGKKLSSINKCERLFKDSYDLRGSLYIYAVF